MMYKPCASFPMWECPRPDRCIDKFCLRSLFFREFRCVVCDKAPVECTCTGDRQFSIDQRKEIK